MDRSRISGILILAACMYLLLPCAEIQTTLAETNHPKQSGKSSTTPALQEPLILGMGIPESEEIEIEKIVLNTEMYLGKEVTTFGIATASSPDGSWIHIADREKTLNITAATDQFIFPKDIDGRKVLVRGFFQKVVVKDKDLEAFIADHKGALKKENYPEGLTYFEIKASGAKILN